MVECQADMMLNESIAKCWVSTDKMLNPEGFCINIDSNLKAGDFWDP